MIFFECVSVNAYDMLDVFGDGAEGPALRGSRRSPLDLLPGRQGRTDRLTRPRPRPAGWWASVG